MDLPILCTLTGEELQERRRTILSFIRELATGIDSLTDGFAYSFKSDSETLREIARLVDLERRCCQFLTFKIVVEPGEMLRLEVTGPPEARGVITDYFGESLSAILTCPGCQHQQPETIPSNHCMFIYECSACGEVIRPKPGDCCVFCSYGSRKCLFV
jgi:hypothetical protein